MSRFFAHFADWIVDRPWLPILLIAIITGFAANGYWRPEFVMDFLKSGDSTADVDETTDEEQEESAGPPDVNPFSVADADAIIVAESDHFFTPDGARALRNVAEKLEATPYVRSVVWLDRVPILNIFGLPEPASTTTRGNTKSLRHCQRKDAGEPAGSRADAVCRRENAAVLGAIRYVLHRIG